MFERFTDRARRVVVIAQEAARDLNHSYIGTEHLLLGLLREGGGVAAQALSDLSVLESDIEIVLKEMAGPVAASPIGHIPFTPRVKKVIELSLREALQLGHNYIGTEHLLLAIIREGDGIAIQALARAGTDPTQVRTQVIFRLSGYTAKPTVSEPLLPDPFGPSYDDAEDLATLMISGVLAGEHDKARPVLDALRRMGWRPPAGP